jgi:hypothetical protein
LENKLFRPQGLIDLFGPRLPGQTGVELWQVLRQTLDMVEDQAVALAEDARTYWSARGSSVRQKGVTPCRPTFTPLS